MLFLNGKIKYNYYKLIYSLLYWHLNQKEEGPKITTKKTASKITELQSFGNTDNNSKKSETKKVYATRGNVS